MVDDFILFDRLNEDYQRITKKIIKKKINLNHLNKKRINNKQKLNNKDLQILKRYFKEDFKTRLLSTVDQVNLSYKSAKTPLVANTVKAFVGLMS